MSIPLPSSNTLESQFTLQLLERRSKIFWKYLLTTEPLACLANGKLRWIHIQNEKPFQTTGCVVRSINSITHTKIQILIRKVRLDFECDKDSKAHGGRSRVKEALYSLRTTGILSCFKTTDLSAPQQKIIAAPKFQRFVYMQTGKGRK